MGTQSDNCYVPVGLTADDVVRAIARASVILTEEGSRNKVPLYSYEDQKGQEHNRRGG